MKVTLLGTGGTIPTLRRNLPAIALQRDGDIFLFDCGEGTQVQFLKASLSPGKLFAICLTHLHGDHVTGLPGLLMTIMQQSRERSLFIFGPPGIREFITLFKKSLGFNPSYFLDVREISEGRFYSGPNFFMEAVAVDHKPRTLAYCLQEAPRPGRFHPEKAKELGVPEGPLFGRLQRGETLTLESEKVITPSMVMGSPRKGRKFVYVTDTRPCPQVVAFADDADLLIHEGMFISEMENEAHLKGHSTVGQAAQIAKDARVRKFVITHISSRYRRTDELRKEAHNIFPGAIVGKDLMEILIPLHK
ncbi:MAG: ribonuclease Z [Deltaproteobacteria bacterium]|nr:ribonuclease Z [Deltaproteobacteria bacterium]